MSPILCWAGSGTVKEFHVSEDVFHVFKEEYLSLHQRNLELLRTPLPAFKGLFLEGTVLEFGVVFYSGLL